jgi:hypothetical protein
MKSIVQTIAILAIAVLMYTIWHDGGAAAGTIKDVLGWCGGLLQETLDKVSSFAQQL